MRTVGELAAEGPVKVLELRHAFVDELNRLEPLSCRRVSDLLAVLVCARKKEDLAAIGTASTKRTGAHGAWTRCGAVAEWAHCRVAHACAVWGMACSALGWLTDGTAR